MQTLPMAPIAIALLPSSSPSSSVSPSPSPSQPPSSSSLPRVMNTVPTPVPLPLLGPAAVNEFKLSDLDVQWSDKDRYLLGRGGNGEVWKGKWLKHTDVAVKVLLPHLIGTSLEAKASFMREMSLLRSIRHPHVVQYIGATETDKGWLLVTELCGYRSLHELLAAPSMRSKLTWSVRKRMIREAAIGLGYLHACKIVHMDVKPLNFLVTEHMAIKVGDFGLSKRLDNSLANASVKGLTITHSAPETVLEGKCSFPSDVYSFSLVMYELLTLTPPWTLTQIGDKPQLFPMRVAMQDLRPICPTDMPSDHRTLLESAWVTDPSKRITMSDLITAIDRLSDLSDTIPTPSLPASNGPSVNEQRLSDELLRVSSELERVTQQLVAAEEMVMSLRATNDSLEYSYNQARHEHAALNQQYRRLQHECDQLHDELRRMRDTTRMTSSTSAHSHGDDDAKYKQSQDQVRSLQTENERLLQRIKQLEESNTKLQQQLTSSPTTPSPSPALPVAAPSASSPPSTTPYAPNRHRVRRSTGFDP